MGNFWDTVSEEDRRRYERYQKCIRELEEEETKLLAEEADLEERGVAVSYGLARELQRLRGIWQSFGYPQRRSARPDTASTCAS